MFNHIKQFVGSQIVVSIGEPWNFVSAAGKNRLDGRIEAVEFSENGQPRILCSVSPFHYCGKEIRQVIALNRYMGSQDVMAALYENQGSISNFVYLISGRLLTAEEINTTIEDPDHSGKKFLTGSIKCVQPS